MSDTQGKFRQHEEEDHNHQPHEIDEVLVDGQDTFHIRIIRNGRPVDIIVDVGSRVEVSLSRRLRFADGKALFSEPRVMHFTSVVMIFEDIVSTVVEQDVSFRVDHRHADIFLRDFVEKTMDDAIRFLTFFVLDAVMNLIIVRL